MEIIKLKITGTRPLLMHADIFADPLNPLTKAHKELTSKRKKTDEDHEAIAKSEWRGGLYFDEVEGPYIPGVNLEASIVAGAKMAKLGSTVKKAVEVLDERCRLEYTGPRDVAGLWEARFYDARSVKVQTARLMRYRPMFRNWHFIAEIAFDETVINRNELLKAINDAGQLCGIGDYRPKFGRFSVEVL